jgi:hypothetical protein
MKPREYLPGNTQPKRRIQKKQQRDEKSKTKAYPVFLLEFDFLFSG